MLKHCVIAVAACIPMLAPAAQWETKASGVVNIASDNDMSIAQAQPLLISMSKDKRPHFSSVMVALKPGTGQIYCGDNYGAVFVSFDGAAEQRFTCLSMGVGAVVDIGRAVGIVGPREQGDRATVTLRGAEAFIAQATSAKTIAVRITFWDAGRQVEQVARYAIQ